MAESASAFLVVTTIRAPARMSSTPYSISFASRFISGTPGGTRSWMNIGISKSPFLNAVAMWWKWRTMAARLAASFGSLHSARRLREPAASGSARLATMEAGREEGTEEDLSDLSPLLHEMVRGHLKTFLAEMEQDGRGLPRFVVAEFERYLRCGILAHGFARVRCVTCGDDLLVAFSCKTRGICPSCTTPRMQGTATHLVDRVLPHVPMRQWVLSLPRWARFLLAREPALITRVLRLALGGIFARQRLRARRMGVRDTRSGAVTFVQRFGSALNLNVHFHCVVPDGVWTGEGGAVRFVPLPGLTDDDVAQVLRRLESRIRAFLKPGLDALRHDARPPDALAASQAESVSALRGKPPDASDTRHLAAYH